MKYAYLLASRELDEMFGLGLKRVPTAPAGISPPELYIAETIKRAYGYNPIVRDVVVVDNNERKGLVRIANVYNKKRPDPSDVSPRMNPGIRLDGDYLDELTNYLIEESEADRIVIARLRISPAVKGSMENLIREPYLRAVIFPIGH